MAERAGAVAAASDERTGDCEAPNLARELKEVSGVGVASLARIVGVSRTRYHLWLRHGGIGPEKIPRVMGLIAVFRELRPIIGADMRGFVRSESTAGSIEELLSRGETKAVIGLALHSPPDEPPGRPSDAAHQISGTPGWIRPARRLVWNVPVADDATRQQTLDEYGAGPIEADLYLPGAESDEGPFPGAVHIVYE